MSQDTSSAPSCETCRWWEWIAENTGSCRRRRSPYVIGGLHGPMETAWPETEGLDYCGEHQPQEAQP